MASVSPSERSVRSASSLACAAFASIVSPTIDCRSCGGIGQLVERLVRNEKARGSNPLTSKAEGLEGDENLFDRRGAERWVKSGALRPEPKRSLDNPLTSSPSLGAQRNSEGCHAEVKRRRAGIDDLPVLSAPRLRLGRPVEMCAFS